MATDQEAIRDVLKSLHPSVAHKAAEAPSLEELYAPASHADALDPERALVVGGRGVGKSFWAAVLADETARRKAAELYPQLQLEKWDVLLGFHEGAQGAGTLAPSPASLKRALALVEDPTWIWRSVVLGALAPEEGPRRLSERVEWLQNDPETYDEIIFDKDQPSPESRKLLLVFDALDVLANDWDTIRKLTIGLARVALEMSSRNSIRIKMFMRTDQFEDMRRKTFSDFSKLRTGAVELDWKWTDLYGALFTRLWRADISERPAKEIARSFRLDTSGDLPMALRRDENIQQKFFSAFAGEFMGTNRKRGLTYTWVPKHLADGHGDTSLRSFLIAIKEAAGAAQDRTMLAIDYVGINQGVLKASETRREEIQEDHPWIQDALAPLGGLTVPCEEEEILIRWEHDKVIDKIQSRSDPERPAAPIQLSIVDLEFDHWAGEMALMEALIGLGIAERRAYDRINIPDIYRVAAKIKRKGGVAPKRR